MGCGLLSLNEWRGVSVERMKKDRASQLRHIPCPYCGGMITWFLRKKKSDDEKDENKYLMTEEVCKNCGRSSWTFDVEVEIIGGNER